MGWRLHCLPVHLVVVAFVTSSVPVPWTTQLAIVFPTRAHVTGWALYFGLGTRPSRLEL